MKTNQNESEKKAEEILNSVLSELNIRKDFFGYAAEFLLTAIISRINNEKSLISLRSDEHILALSMANEKSLYSFINEDEECKQMIHHFNSPDKVVQNGAVKNVFQGFMEKKYNESLKKNEMAQKNADHDIKELLTNY